MLDWIRQNSDMLSVIASFGTLLVWIFYAQLLFSGFKRQRRPRVLINKGVGFRDLDSPCLICNMSQEAIFVQFILVHLKTNQGTFMVPATDYEEGAIDEGDESRATRQGPLSSEACMEMKSFGLAVAKAAKHGGIQTERGLPSDPDVRFYSVQLTVLYIYGPDDKPVGAQRKFEFRYDEDTGFVGLHPTTVDSNRLTTLRHRRLIRKWLHTYL